MSLRSDIKLLRRSIADARELRRKAWPDDSGARFDRRYLGTLDEVAQEYDQAVIRISADIEDAFARL